jgi:hypothetical protein
MTFEIQSDLPLPPRTAGRRGSKYPLTDMEVGQAFLVGADDEGKAVKATTVRSAIGAFNKRNPGRKFAVRINTDGSVGVWRVA